MDLRVLLPNAFCRIVPALPLLICVTCIFLSVLMTCHTLLCDSLCEKGEGTSINHFDTWILSGSVYIVLSFSLSSRALPTPALGPFLVQYETWVQNVERKMEFSSCRNRESFFVESVLGLQQYWFPSSGVQLRSFAAAQTLRRPGYFLST